MWDNPRNQSVAWGFLFAGWYLAMTGAVLALFSGFETFGPPHFPRFREFIWTCVFSFLSEMASPLLMSPAVIWLLIFHSDRSTHRGFSKALPGLLAGLASLLLLWVGFPVMCLLVEFIATK